MVIAGAAVSIGAAAPAQASTISDQQCLAEATGQLIAPSRLVEGNTALVQWSAQAPCSATRQISGPGFDAAQSLPPTGSRTVAMNSPGTATWTFSLTATRSGRTVEFDSQMITVVSQELNDGAFALHAASGPLQTLTAEGVTTSSGPAAMAATSPAVVSVLTDNGRSSGRVTAYQATDGFLRVISPTGGVSNTWLGMKAGTSPSITTTSTGYLIAFQANTGELWTVDQAGAAYDTRFIMAPGTNPSIARSSSGDAWIAYQGSDRLLRYVSPDHQAHLVSDGRRSVMPKTSPSLSLDPHGQFTIAYQGATGTVWVVHNFQAAENLQLPMAPGSSPNMVADIALAGAVVFVAADQSLWYYSLVGGNRGRVSNGLGVAPGTSPTSFVGATDHLLDIGFQAAVEGTLWTVDVESPDYYGHDTGIPMAPGTSPAGVANGVILR